ncbi:hypothetical protein D3C85_1292650 [compost metagenome]
MQLDADLRHLQTLGFERSAKHHFARALGDVDKTTGADQRAPQVRHVDVALTVHFAHAEKRQVHPAAAVEIELIQGRHNRLRVTRGAKHRAAHHPAVVNALLDAAPIAVLQAAFGEQ